MLAQFFSEKTILVLVTLIGMAVCTVGIGQVAARGEWSNPMAILAYVIGALILLIVGAALFDVQLPLIDSPRAALISVIVLALAKVILTQLHRAFA
jgi:hypothetical protein